MNTWIIVAIGVFGVILLVIGIVLSLRAWNRGFPRTRAPSRLSTLWRRFLRSLPGSAAGDPVIVVLGDRLAGKSRAIAAGFELEPGRAYTVPDAPEDGRLTCFASRGLLVQEVSGDLLGNSGPESIAELRALWRMSALSVPLVVCVIDTSASSWSPAGLTRLGGLARDKIEILASLRGSVPSVCICLTHMDLSAEGFVEVAGLARPAGPMDPLRPTGITAPLLAQTVDWLDPYVGKAVRERSVTELGKAARFGDTNGPRVISELAPFLDALLVSRPRSTAPARPSIVLFGGDAGSMIGDPFSLQESVVAKNVRALNTRRAMAAAVVTALFTLLLAGVYRWQWYAIDRASQAVTHFANVERDAEQAGLAGLGSDTVSVAEGEAADAIDSATAYFWPPLRIAYPRRMQKLTDDISARFVQPLRQFYLYPAATGPDHAGRVLALALLYAPNDESLRDAVHSGADEWATGLHMPKRVVFDYIKRSEAPWRDRPPLPPPSTVTTLAAWQSWFQSIDDVLARGKIERDELAEMQQTGRTLSASIESAVDLHELEGILVLLRNATGHSLDAFLGGGAEPPRTPAWVTANLPAIRAVLALVAQATLDVPSPEGKTLQGAVTDLQSLVRAGPASQAKEYSILVGGEPHVYSSESWASLILANRASLYVKAFVYDVRSTGRPLFFATILDYPAVKKGGGRSKGPARSLPGTATQAAFGNEVQPALTNLGPAAAAARVPTEDLAALDLLVRESTTKYARAYAAALWEYIKSFTIDVTSAAGLRGDLEEMVSPTSWFNDFWNSVADNVVGVDAGNDYLSIIGDALAPFTPIKALMSGPKLDGYYAIVTPIVASIDVSTPPMPGPAGAALADRLPPLGKLGLAILDTTKPAPFVQVTDWLDKSGVVDGAFRKPFIAPIEFVYTFAIQNVEQTIDVAYRDQLRPQITPFLTRFPFDRTATSDASPEELSAVLGPKGSFPTGLAALLSPVCQKGDGYVPLAPIGFPAVRLPAEATQLAAWTATLDGALWDDGKPKPIALNARPQRLPGLKIGDPSVATLSFLRSGTTTAYGFNQAPNWQPLSVAWSEPSAAAAGVEWSDLASAEKYADSSEGTGSAWSFFRLLCKAKADPTSDGLFTWRLKTPITFELTPDPWGPIVPPMNRLRTCGAHVTRN